MKKNSEQNLKDMKIAILVTDGFEQSEMTEPKKALEKSGAKPHIISPNPKTVKGWTHDAWGDEFTVDKQVDKADPSQYEALVLPGGVMNPDKLRISKNAITFIKHFVDQNKPIAAICHGPWTLINAHGVKGKTMTSWPSIKDDLQNAGAHWVDKEVVKDENLVTSRKPDDLPAFNEKMIELFASNHPHVK
jgi:protease I